MSQRNPPWLGQYMLRFARQLDCQTFLEVLGTLRHHNNKSQELDEGAVLVTDAEHKNRIGFYCLQSEQTYDIGKLAACPNCRLSMEQLTKVTTNLDESERRVDTAIEVDIGTHCEAHRQALLEHEMAVVYWDRPYSNEYSLVHPSLLVNIPSTTYAQYVRECRLDVKEAFARLLSDLQITGDKV